MNGLELRDVDVSWDDSAPEPAWGSALVLRDIEGLRMDGFRGRAGARAPGVPAIVKERVREAPL